MRRGQKLDILELIDNLYESHAQFGELIEEKKYDIGLELLCDCQECAIDLGDIIECLEGNRVVTISYIEKYCETLFNCHEKLSNSISTLAIEKKRIVKIVNTLNKSLYNIENSIKNDIKVKKEVVFFPYKVSMWDSLESIYLAAKKDENCDVYCVPIPYFNKNQYNGISELHYEGDQYPDYIEITDWRNYDYKERKPDIIYIHNPYDEFNIVTSVHENYYARNLKQYTDKLVYVPYFVLSERSPSNTKLVEKMKHYCYLPGTIYADKVVLQSEDMRQIYINEYRNALALQGVNIEKEKLKNKFIGIGSPKFDKIKNIDLNSIDIPVEWSKKIKKENGEEKKVVLYNTSISSLLRAKENMLIKIRSVLEIFKQLQEDIVLLWRPHPLIEATIKSMLPALWDEYKSIILEYIKEGWGIYDDTPDLYRAILISDAYYGDVSSVVQLYKITEKPIMIQSESVS